LVEKIRKADDLFQRNKKAYLFHLLTNKQLKETYRILAKAIYYKKAKIREM
jgi:hypothetical protein